MRLAHPVSRSTRSLQQAVQRSDGFLPARQHLAEVRLRLFQRGLTGFAGGDVLVQGGLYFRFGRLRINGLLQRIGSRVGRAAETAAPLLALLALRVGGLAVIAAPGAATPEHAATHP